MQINNINSDFLNDFSAAPQESVVGKFYWIVSLITFFRVIQSANAHNFADDDTLTAFSKKHSKFDKSRRIWMLRDNKIIQI